MQKCLEVTVMLSSMTDKWILYVLWKEYLQHTKLVQTIFRRVEKDHKWLNEKGSFFLFSLPKQSKYKKKLWSRRFNSHNLNDTNENGHIYPYKKKTWRKGENILLYRESWGRNIDKLCQPVDKQQKGTEHWSEIRWNRY